MALASGTKDLGRPTFLRVLSGPRLYLWVVSAAWLIIAALGLASESDEIGRHLLDLLPWAALVAVLNLMPVRVWQSTNLAVDLPVAAAAGLILSPLETGLVGFLGTFDTKELRGQITPSKALFNRSQVGLADYLGSFCVHQVSADPASSELVFVLSFLLLAIVLLANYTLVGLALTLEYSFPFATVVRRLRLGTPADFSLTLAGWGVLAVMLTALYEQYQELGLLAFLLPALICRQALTRSQMYIEASRAYEARQQALSDLSRRIQEERSDERRLIAADLHDDVLQPLFKVSLMAHVLKADLASGRLLDLDQDLPELLSAAELSATTLRELIGDLRRSTLGRTGLRAALLSLLRALSKETTTSFHADIEELTANPTADLAIYQIAKEALGNATAHARAKNIWVTLHKSEHGIALTVRDDGVGFDPYIQYQGHYGLHIMKERATLVGGFLAIDSTPGYGCSLALDVPV